MILNKLFKKDYHVSAYDSKKGNSHYIQLFENKYEAREYLQDLLDSELNDFSAKTLNEHTLEKDYLEKRTYSYKIKNDKFSEVQYIKKNAPLIYKKYLSKQ